MKNISLVKIVRKEESKGKGDAALQMDMIWGGCCEKNYLDCRSLGTVWCAKSVAQGLRTAADMQEHFEKILEKHPGKGMDRQKTQSVPVIKEISDALGMIMEAAKDAGLTPGKDVWLTVDAGADALHQADSGLYFFPGETRAKCEELENREEEVTAQQPDTICTQINRSTAEIVEFYRKILGEFPVMYIQNALEGKDTQGWELLLQTLGKKWERKENDLVAAELVCKIRSC